MYTVDVDGVVGHEGSKEDGVGWVKMKSEDSKDA